MGYIPPISPPVTYYSSQMSQGVGGWVAGGLVELRLPQKVLMGEASGR